MGKPFLAMIGGFVLAFSMFVGGLMFAIVFLVPGEPWQQPARIANDSDLWTDAPRRVEIARQDVERVAPPSDRTSRVTTDIGDPAEPTGAEALVDRMTTSAIQPGTVVMDDAAETEPAAMPTEADNPAAARLFQAHAEWCSRRYRSYDAGSNSYSPYSGGRRPCFSPYAAEYAALTGAPVPSDPHVRFAPSAGRLAPEPSIERVEPQMIEAEVERVEAQLNRVETVEVRGTVEVTAEPRRPILGRLFGRDCSSYRSYDPATNTYQPFGGGPRRVCG
jgi:hypothetical protein